MSSAGGGPRADGNLPLATSATSAGPSEPPNPGKNGTQGGNSGFGFPKSARLLKRREFRRVYDQGSRVTSSSFALFYAAQTPTPGAPRIGFTTPKALGKAVVRNRIRRRMREAVRLQFPFLTAGVDYVFHPRRSVLEVGFAQLRREVERIFRKCELPAVPK